LTQLARTERWLDEVIEKGKVIISELARESFIRYRQLGQLIIDSGYEKGKWHDEEKAKVIEEWQISRQTFSRLVQFGEMPEAEFAHVMSNFQSLDAYINRRGLPSETETDVPASPEIEKVVTTIKRGDVLTLGRHRVMCGDATSRDDVAKLMQDKRADLLLTDPPYGISVVKDGHNGRAFAAKLTSFVDFEGDNGFDIKLILDLECYDKMVIWGGNYFSDKLPISNSWLVWDKHVGERCWFSDFELAWSNLGCGARLIKLVWQGMIREGEHEKRVHPTQKPIELMYRILMDLAPNANIVLDLFGGSGSTLLACEQANRTCYMMEIDPRYCQIIVDRWYILKQKLGGVA
jgi:DNA modification methylase